MPQRVALYARTVACAASAIDEQIALLQPVAAHRGWHIVAVHTDITQISSGGRDRRPGLDNLLRLVWSSSLDLMASWSVCRLGRSLADLIHIFGELRAGNVDLYLHEQAIDTTIPSGRTLFETVDIFTQYQRAMARERAIVGQRRAVLNGVRIGRPPLTAAKLRQVRAALDAGQGIRETARLCGISPTAVHRIKGEIMDPASTR